MKYQDKIATSRLDRTIRFIGTGAKIGGNYLKHYAKKTVNPSLDKEELHRDNAEDIYATLSSLKGSALKVAQMLSMDRAVLPKAYSDKFTMAQYQAPPLSAPLVVQTFVKSLGKKPNDIFDTFSLNARNAASIGQVHEASLDSKKLAVKVQYPGVADSIQSDLRMVKPIALRMFNLSEKDLQKYIQEVEGKLLEETDYVLELRRSTEISEACAHLEGLVFAKYYQELSSSKILTMDWLEGKHLDEFLAPAPSQEVKNQAGQNLWDFYSFQVHNLRAVHADPHPGNFLLMDDGKVGVIDFGCVKEIPEDFYYDYFALILPSIQARPTLLEELMERIEMLYPADSVGTRAVFKDAFGKMIHLLALPFASPSFDFGNHAYMSEIYALGEEISNNATIRNAGEGRGSRHMLYINRTYFGLYSLLNQLNATIQTGTGSWAEKIEQHFKEENRPIS